MKISTNTVNILKNFAKINPSIVISEGNTLKTISPSKTIMAKAKVDTQFDKRFAIYNLDRFISTMGLFNDPELKFGDKSVIISDNNKKSQYTYADESTVTKAPDKEIGLPTVDVTFTITNDNLRTLRRQLAFLPFPRLLLSAMARL